MSSKFILRVRGTERAIGPVFTTFGAAAKWLIKTQPSLGVVQIIEVAPATRKRSAKFEVAAEYEHLS